MVRFCFGILNYIFHYQVDKDHYQSQLRKKSLAMLTAATFRTDLGLDEDDLMREASSSAPYVNEEQRDREIRGKMKAEEAINLKFLGREARKDAAVKPTLARAIGNKEKVALIQSIIAAKDLMITTTHGNSNMLDIFLSGVSTLNKPCARALLRMLYMLPSEMPCIKILRQNLLAFAELSPATENLRQLEWTWAWKLLMILHNLGKTTTISSQNIIYNLTMLKKDTGKEYYLGNTLIHHLVTSMESSSLAMAELTARSLAAMERRAAIQVAPVQDNPEVALPEAGAVQGGVQAAQQVDAPDAWDDEDEGAGALISTLPGRAAGYVFVEDASGGRTITAGKVGTPVKILQGKSKAWTDDMKLQLLELYCLHAPDPLTRAATESGKAAHKSNLKKMAKHQVYMEDASGERCKYYLENFDVDNLANIMQKFGLKNQPKFAKGKGKPCGLVHLLDEYLEDKDLVDDGSKVEFIRGSAGAIVAWAKDKYSKGVPDLV